MDFLDYPDVSMEYRGVMVDGRVKLTDEKVIFKPSKSGGGKGETIERQEIELVNWQRLAGSWGIRIFTKKGYLHRFAGFKDGEREKLAKFFKQSYDLEMLDKELSVKGHNWGMVEFEGGLMSFDIGKAKGFEIPLSYVNQCLDGKNEATLEFHLNDDAAVNLSEMRFHIPGSELAGEDPVADFRDKVMSKASVVVTSGDAIAIFREISCLSPRGRYDIKIFPNFIHLHGKTFDYKIPASSVIRLFLLPHKDQRQMHFAVNLDPPIKQGQTRYHFLVFNFKMDEEDTVELPFTEEEVKEKFDGKLEQTMEGPIYELLSRIIKAITSKKVTQPKDFTGYSGTQALTCSHKAASGFIYPLERGLIFIYKPPIFLRYDEVKSVIFERSGGSTRSFDISVTSQHDIVYTFSSIEKNEYERLYQYLKSKKVNVKSSGKGAGGTLTWDDDDKVDHYLEGVKRDAEDMSDYSMSSDDTDFNPDALEALSAKEEYDSEPSSTSSDSDGEEQGEEAEKRREERKKKKEERLEKAKRRSEKGGGTRKKREGGGKKKKLTKIPGQPKKPLSAYFIFMNANREKLQKENPSSGIGDIAKKAGEIWRTMEDKSEWEEKAKEDKKRYEEEYAKWKEEGGEEKLKAAKKAAKAAERAATKGSPKKKASKSGDGPKKVNLTQAGTGSSYKSAEFVVDSDSSDDNKKSDSSDGGSKKKKATPKKKKDESSDAKSDSDKKSSSASASASAASDSD